jgi:hypothetical protein
LNCLLPRRMGPSAEFIQSKKSLRSQLHSRPAPSAHLVLTSCATMATTLSSSLSLKRPSPLSSSDASTSKKRRKVSTRRHYIHHRLCFHPDSAAVPPNAEIIQSLLEQAIGRILTVVGFDGVDPDALQAFRVHVEECVCIFPSLFITQVLLPSFISG